MKEEYPLVSVAIITYNQKDYLKDCILSCLSQDYPNIEIVIADDCSTDGTQEMLCEYQKQYPDKFVIKLAEKNLGITSNSNAAHFSCTGKYIAWMGGDDLMLPGKIKKQVEFMEANPECAISYHNLDVFDSVSGETISFYNSKFKINGGIRHSIRYGTFNGACSTMVRTKCAPSSGFNVLLPVASDWLFWVDTLSSGGNIRYIDEVLGRYRKHSNNVTKSEVFITKNELDKLLSCQIIISKYPEYFNDAMYAYSKVILCLRHKLNYYSVMWKSFIIRPSAKVLGALFLSLITFGKVKL